MAPLPLDTVIRHLEITTTLALLPVPSQVPGQERLATVWAILHAGRRAVLGVRGRRAASTTMTMTLAVIAVLRVPVVCTQQSRVAAGETGVGTRLGTPEAGPGDQMASPPRAYTRVTGADVVTQRRSAAAGVSHSTGTLSCGNCS